MNRKALVLAGVLGLTCLFGNTIKTYALGTETVNGHLVSRIQKNKVSGFSALMWNNKTQGSTTAIYNEAGSSTIAGGTLDTSNIFDTKVVSIRYASITGNGTPTFSIYGLNGTTSTGMLLPLELSSNVTVTNPWNPTTTTGSSATFVISTYCEKIAVGLESASGGTVTGITISLAAVNEIP